MRVVICVGFILAVGVSMALASCVGRTSPPSPPGTFTEGQKPCTSYDNRTIESTVTYKTGYNGTPQCHECECQNGELSCCGYGIRTGVWRLSPGCTVEKNTCDFNIIQDEDEDQPCEML